MIREDYTSSDNLSTLVGSEQWGIHLADAIKIHRLSKGYRLSAILVAPDSQIDQVWIGPQAKSDVQLCGVKNPWFPPDSSEASDLFVYPYQFFGSAMSSTVKTYWDSPFADPFSIESLRGQLYGRKGGYLHLHAYYDGIPSVIRTRRDNFQREHILGSAAGYGGVANAVPAGTTLAFRNIIVGRDAWEMSSLNIDAAMVWTIYGCTEAIDNITPPLSRQRRDSLATGTGSFSYQGSRGYDAIEVDMANGGGAGTAHLRFAARDW